MILTKESVAQTQIETAIWIWFHYGDPVSITALAANANDCYRALGGHKGIRSSFKEWLNNQPKLRQERIRYVLNWIKHGKMDMKNKPVLATNICEALIVDCIECHENLFSKKTKLMALFAGRMIAERPALVRLELSDSVRAAVKMYDFADKDRKKFLRQAFKRDKAALT